MFYRVMISCYEYDPVGNTTAKYIENGTSALFTYDAAHRLTGIQHRNGLTLLESIAYTLDKVGNRTAKTINGFNPITENYTYDLVRQLTQAKYGTARTVAYSYDASGNRQVVTDNGGAKSYAANALNQYTSVGGSTLSYDANGNLTGDGNGGSYTYDAQNRLVQASVGGIVTTFAYDSRNRVVQRTDNGVVQNLTYNGWNLIEERDGTGALQQVYVHGAKVDELLTKISSTGAVYYHADGSGSTVALTDETGSVVESMTYDAFGAATIWNASGVAIPTSSYQNRILFTGREWLSDAGIYDYRNRAYSPTLGRFLQTDPIRFSAGDRNIYRYCGNNPLNGNDPTGLCSMADNRPPTLPDDRTPHDPNDPLDPLSPHYPDLFPWTTITGTGNLRLDDDGSGSSHLDPDHNPETAYQPNGKNLNADKDSYVVAPLYTQADGVRAGDSADVTVNGQTQSSVVGDFGPNSQGWGEMSITQANNFGQNSVDVPKVGPTLTTNTPVPVSVTVYPSGQPIGGR